MGRVIAAAVAAVALTATLLTGSATAMPGNCDPASRGATYNEIEQAQGNGLVVVYIRFGWDGVSAAETGCVGDLMLLRLTNNSTAVWYVHFLGRTGNNPKTIQMDPGTLRTLQGGQLTSRGLLLNTDVDLMFIDTSPTPPSSA